MDSWLGLISDEVRRSIIVFTLILPRMIAAFYIIQFMKKELLGGTMARNGLIFSFALFAYPVVEYSFPDTISGGELLLILLKETVIGLFLGFIISIAFWAIESVGAFIDNQRGASIASSFDPMVGDQASPLSMLLSKMLITLFFVSGIFLAFMKGLYSSYETWPIASFVPHFGWHNTEFFLAQFDLLLKIAIFIGAPIIIAMFIAELGLGLVGRFAPQLNVFFLAMPIKSAVAIVMLVLILGIFFRYFDNLLSDSIANSFELLEEVWQ